MQDLNANNISDPELRAKVAGIPGTVVSQLRAIEAFKPVQNWALFRAPGTLMRLETLQLGKAFDEITSKSGGRKLVRKVVVGGRGSGKSIHLLQAMTMAFLKGWVVINLPEGLKYQFRSYIKCYLMLAQLKILPTPIRNTALFLARAQLSTFKEHILHPYLAVLLLQIPS